MSGVRGHEPACPIARETWCVWTGDKCDWCSAYKKGRSDAWAELVAASIRLAEGIAAAVEAANDADEAQAELEFASLHEEGLA